MPATFTTREIFEKSGTPKSDVEGERALRIRAGAIRSRIDESQTHWILVTEWNVIGEG